MALGLPRKRLRLASAAELASKFGSVAGAVPPVPLRPGVRVLGMYCLAAAPSLVCGAGHRQKRLLLSLPSTSLPALVAAAASADATAAAALATTTGHFASPAPVGLHRSVCAGAAQAPPPVFEWLPPPEDSLLSLEEAIARSWAAEASRLAGGPPGGMTTPSPGGIPAAARRGTSSLGPSFGGAAVCGGRPPPPPPLRLLMDCSLAPVARKLRMVGIDTRVAGARASRSPCLYTRGALGGAQAYPAPV